MNALRYILDNPVNEAGIVEYLDKMAGALAHVFMDWKKHSPWFLAGQVCLCLCTSYVDDGKSILINGHYVRLSETKSFDLMINNASKIAKDKTNRRRRCVFPPINEDILLDLVLMESKGFRTLRGYNGILLPFHQALSNVDEQTRALNFENNEQPVSDGMELEALVAGSIVLTSHQGGFSGIGFDAFFSALLYKLGMRESPDDQIAFALPLSGLQIPFLSLPNVEWSYFLPTELNLRNLKRTKNNDQIDLLVPNNSLSAECKDHKDKLELGDMKRIIKRVPKQTTVYLVVTNSLQDSYFTRRNTFDDFVTHEQLIWLQHTFFYRIRINTRLVKIKGIENKYRKPNC